MEVPFDRASATNGKWCNQHVDVDILPGDGRSTQRVRLQPACGIGAYRDPDGHGVIGGFSINGGSFVYDGLVTAPDRWDRAHYLRKRRFRYIGASAVNESGDVRAFVLAPSFNATAAPHVEMSDCRAQLGCSDSDAAVACACVSVCAGTRLRWAAVTGGRLRAVRTVGTCGPGSSNVTSESLVAAVRRVVGLPSPPLATAQGACAACELPCAHSCQAYNPRVQRCAGAPSDECPCAC